MSRDVGQALPPANPEFTNVWQAKAPAPPFDCIATRYDALWTDTAIGRAQRNLVWHTIDGLFHTGDRILDIGCGTGEDAAHFAARGVHVYATDASPAMVQVAPARSAQGARHQDSVAHDERQPGRETRRHVRRCRLAPRQVPDDDSKLAC